MSTRDLFIVNHYRNYVLVIGVVLLAHANWNSGLVAGLARKSRAYLAAIEAQLQRKQRLERREGSRRPFG